MRVCVLTHDNTMVLIYILEYYILMYTYLYIADIYTGIPVYKYAHFYVIRCLR